MQLSIFALWAFVAVAMASPLPAADTHCPADIAPVCAAKCLAEGLDFDCWGKTCICGSANGRNSS